MKKNPLYISAAFLLVFLANSCTEKVDVNVGETYVRLVVDGSVTTDTMVHSVTLTKSADYFYNAPSPTVTDAKVTVSDGDSVYILRETEPGVSGIYQTNASFHGIPGKTYTLNIRLTEPINGFSDYSASSFLNPVAKLDSTNAVLHDDWGPKGIWEVRGYAQEPANETNYYMFNLYRNGKLMTDSIQKLPVSDDKFINGSYFNGGVVYLNNEREDEKLAKGDTLLLVMSGITKEYMDFVQQVQQSGYNIPFFSGPPANIIGNISNGAIGFFTAYSNSKVKGIVR
jgi:hypothetical protein